VLNALREAPGWLIVLAAFGVVGICTAILTMFFKLGDRPGRTWTDSVDPIDSDGFMRPVAALLGVPLRQGGHIQLINNGDAWIATLLADIAAAQRSITFAVYIWEPGQMSDMVFEALTDRARDGVEVRVLLDGLGCIRCPREGIETLRKAGARVARFRPPRFGTLTRFNQRNHRRAIVIDGTIGFTGGMAVGDKWLGDARNDKEWRDTMVRITGAPVESVQSAFTELWAYVTGEVLKGDAFFPRLDPEASDMFTMGVVSSPAPEEHPLGLFLFLTFLAARRSLWIVTPYFIPDEHTLHVIKQRARAGVDVRVLLPDDHIDAKAIRRASQRYYEQLMDAGVKIYEFQGTMMHTKLIVVDSMFSIIGSANMDIRSNELNEENVIGVLGRQLASDIEKTCLADLERSRRIDAAEWKKRGIGARVLEHTFAFFNEQF
jgi:cardiolipin synthase